MPSEGEEKMAIAPAVEKNVESLRQGWDQYQQENKRAFRYDGAAALGVSEAELLAIECGKSVTRLEGDWTALLQAFGELGRVMALTRNHDAVHEKKGHYKPVSFNGHVGLVLDENIDLRLFMQNWALGFAVHNPDAKVYEYSFQFFDAQGNSVHKVMVEKEHSHAAQGLIDRFRSANQEAGQTVALPVEGAAVRPDDEIDVEGFRAAWAGLKDTHDFYPMIKKFKVSRTQACRLVGSAYAEAIAPQAYRQLFQEAAAREVPIMVFVGNVGCIQIHSGVIRKLFEVPGWYNIMDPGFNLHLREEGVVEAWLTRKPTVDGTVTSLELFDKNGKDIALIFGKRKPGIPELESWRKLAESLPRLS